MGNSCTDQKYTDMYINQISELWKPKGKKVRSKNQKFLTKLPMLITSSTKIQYRNRKKKITRMPRLQEDILCLLNNVTTKYNVHHAYNDVNQLIQIQTTAMEISYLQEKRKHNLKMRYHQTTLVMYLRNKIELNQAGRTRYTEFSHIPALAKSVYLY